MKTRAFWLVVAVLATAILGYWIYKRASAESAPAYRFATIERGDIEAAVSATGTLSAVTTVQVGTQVSGRIVELLADFNTRVKKGQLIARIDPTILEQAVRDAQAGLERAQAELAQREREYERNKGLFERKVLTEVEFNNASYALAVARANVKSAQVAVDRARQNLAYTQIYAPIDGIVVERNVDIGQTVVASMSTPQLFLIAQDLSQMQILASVDESDIGAIHDGQDVRFTVQAYPNQQFRGKVEQVRLQSKTTENVVNYTVVVRVDNSNGKLLPGMTATLDFITGAATDVLLAPNSALRFRPTEEMLAQIRERRAQERGRAAGSGMPGPAADGSGPPLSAPPPQGGEAGASGPRGNGPRFSGGLSAQGGSGPRSRGPAGPALWYLDANGKLAMARVRTGITDGQQTVVESPEIHEGMQVIVGLIQPTQARTSSPMSPFGGPGAGPRGPGMMRPPF